MHSQKMSRSDTENATNSTTTTILLLYSGFGIFANEFVDVVYEVEDLGIVGAPSQEELAAAEKKKKQRRFQARRKKKKKQAKEGGEDREEMVNNKGGGGLKGSDSKKNLNVKFVDSLDDMSSKDVGGGSNGGGNAPLNEGGGENNNPEDGGGYGNGSGIDVVELGAGEIRSRVLTHLIKNNQTNTPHPPLFHSRRILLHPQTLHNPLHAPLLSSFTWNSPPKISPPLWPPRPPQPPLLLQMACHHQRYKP